MKEKLFTVGDVIDKLRVVSPDVTISKLRFWERKGLLKTRRTKGGHRLYCPEDVERLSFILELRTRFKLPLSTVKVLIRRFEKDPTYQFVVMERAFNSKKFDPSFRPFSLSKASRETGFKKMEILKLEEMGLVFSCPVNKTFDEESLETLKVIKKLIAMGIKPEEIVPWARWIKNMVEYEMSLFSRFCKAEKGNVKKREEYREYRKLFNYLQRLLCSSYLRKSLNAVLKNKKNDYED